MVNRAVSFILSAMYLLLSNAGVINMSVTVKINEDYGGNMSLAVYILDDYLDWVGKDLSWLDSSSNELDLESELESMFGENTDHHITSNITDKVTKSIGNKDYTGRQLDLEFHDLDGLNYILSIINSGDIGVIGIDSIYLLLLNNSLGIIVKSDSRIIDNIISKKQDGYNKQSVYGFNGIITIDFDIEFYGAVNSVKSSSRDVAYELDNNRAYIQLASGKEPVIIEVEFEDTRFNGINDSEAQYINDSKARFNKIKDYCIGEFSDIRVSDWFYENVKGAYEYGLISGKSSDLFSPESNVTVAEMIQIISNMDANLTGNTLMLEKLMESGDMWYSGSIVYAIYKGLLKSGLEFGEDYNRNITRDEAAELFIRVIPAYMITDDNSSGSENGSNKADEVDKRIKFFDIDSSNRYYNSIQQLSELGIITGYGDGSFGSGDSITRAQVTAFIDRIVKMVNDWGK